MSKPNIRQRSIWRSQIGQAHFIKQALCPQTCIKLQQIRINNNKDQQNLLKCQIKIHKNLNHPNIIKCFGYIQQDNNFYIILQYASNGNLYQYLKKKGFLKEHQAFYFFYQTVQAINYLHQLKILHRDIKPENILLDQNNKIKLCDFGSSTLNNGRKSTFCGTYQYMAPQMFSSFQKKYDYKIDIWSLGILLFQLLHGYTPFKILRSRNLSISNLQQILLKNKLEINQKLSDSVKDLITKIISPKSDRLQLKGILNHQWIRNNKNRVIKKNNSQVFSKERRRIKSMEMEIMQNKSVLNNSPINFFNIYNILNKEQCDKKTKKKVKVVDMQVKTTKKRMDNQDKHKSVVKNGNQYTETTNNKMKEKKKNIIVK